MDVVVELIGEPALRGWAIASLLLVLKMMASGSYTSSIRIRKKVYASPEDYAMQGEEPKAGADEEVERSRRIHQNDLENNVPFFAAGFVYALTGPSSLGAWVCFAGFPIARVLYTFCYMRSLMPHRTITFMVGYVITAYMAIASLISLL